MFSIHLNGIVEYGLTIKYSEWGLQIVCNPYFFDLYRKQIDKN